MATIQSKTDLKEWLARLREAIKAKNKHAILEAYNVFTEHDFDWDKYPVQFSQYDKLIDAGNDILYS